MPKLSTQVDIAAELENAAAGLSATTERLEALRARVRGTGDHQEAARLAIAAVKLEQIYAPAPPAPPQTLAQKVEAALRQSVLPVNEIALQVGAPVVRVVATIRALGTRVYNVGTADRPRWSWVPGENIGIDELADLVERLITERPLGRQELQEATGVNSNRIGGALYRMQRERKRVINVGTAVRARYFLLPTSVATDRDIRAEVVRALESADQPLTREEIRDAVRARTIDVRETIRQLLADPTSGVVECGESRGGSFAVWTTVRAQRAKLEIRS